MRKLLVILLMAMTLAAMAGVVQASPGDTGGVVILSRTC